MVYPYGLLSRPFKDPGLSEETSGHINIMPMILDMFADNERIMHVPMLLEETFAALNACSRGQLQPIATNIIWRHKSTMRH